MKKGFLLTVALITTMLSISLLPPPLTSNARGVTSVTISTIRNSCIVNNANIAVQNINTTPLDAINNWWGMPTGATHDNIPSGDAVGLNVLHAPHLPTMPFLCDLTSADWIPFSEQELQHAINSHIPYLGGIAFALIDFEWGRGAKFDILTHPNYGSHHLEAKITIRPNPTGELITIALDMTTVPTDENLQKILACELLPLFVNSLQQVQNRYVSPSQNIASMVVMERDLMMRFTPPTEITPEPTPEFVLNYDSLCLPPVALPTPTPSPTPTQNEDESGMLVSIPPLEGEFIELESLQQQAQPVFLIIDTNTDSGALFACDPNIPSDCSLRGAISRANSDPSNHYVIRIPNNIYSLEYGTVTLSGHITLVGDDFYTQPQQARVIIQPSGMTGSLFSITDADVTLYNLTFKNGVNGMLIRGSKVAIYHSRFEDNSAGLTGGAIFITSPNTSSIQIIDTIFTQNTAPLGGAIAIDADAQTSDISINCSTFDENVAEYGGVIFTSTTAQIVGEIRYSNFDNNIAIYSGGAIHSQVNRGIQIRWSYATSPTFSGFANYHVPNSIINAPMAIENSSQPVVFDPSISGCYIPPPPNPTLTVADYINELAKYGIIAFVGGVPSQPIEVWDRINQQYITVNWNSAGTTWTIQELQEILQGVYDTAEAFYLLKYGVSSGEGGNGTKTQQLFKNVMSTQVIWRDWNGVIHDGFFLLRVQNTFVYSNADLCNGSGDEGCTSNNWGAIGLYGNFYPNNPKNPPNSSNPSASNGVENIKYTFVHELGHRFNNQSAIGDGSISLYDYLQNRRLPVPECTNINQIVMGWVSDIDWVRGTRGWGNVIAPSIPSAPLRGNGTRFQQNSISELVGNQYEEIDEATADMFLNWVYRRITDVWSDWAQENYTVSINNENIVVTVWSDPVRTCNQEPNRVDANNQPITWNMLNQVGSGWMGFRNITPQRNPGQHSTIDATWNFTVISFDNTLPGNARYWWMQDVMGQIFGKKSEWTKDE